ncbi:MAG: hypothetical protein IH930_10340, partial [Proteobacteria bacterium]|nr:hypothetical protein [Pseudomonadota bacterium]
LVRGFEIAENLREAITGIRIELNLGGGSFKSQLKRADKSGAEFALVLGDDEVAENRAGLKPLRTDQDQASVALEHLAVELAGRLRRNEDSGLDHRSADQDPVSTAKKQTGYTRA